MKFKKIPDSSWYQTQDGEASMLSTTPLYHISGTIYRTKLIPLVSQIFLLCKLDYTFVSKWLSTGIFQVDLLHKI